MIDRGLVRSALAALVARTPAFSRAPSLTVLMYHAVTDVAVADVGRLSVPASLFEAQVASLYRAGVELVSLGGALARLRSAAVAPPMVAVTFDDAFEGVARLAMPVLRRYGATSTLFVPTDWIGRARCPDADRSLGRPMTWPEIEALAESGVELGSHTHTHRRCTAMTDAAMREELARSCDLIADHTGVRPSSFAYPYGTFGTFNEATRRTLVAAGITTACTTVHGRNGAGADPLALRRVRLSYADPADAALWAASGGYDWYRWVQRAQAACARGGPNEPC